MSLYERHSTTSTSGAEHGQVKSVNDEPVQVMLKGEESRLMKSGMSFSQLLSE